MIHVSMSNYVVGNQARSALKVTETRHKSPPQHVLSMPAYMQPGYRIPSLREIRALLKGN